MRTKLWGCLLILALAFGAAGCSEEPAEGAKVASERLAPRYYAYAPPFIPHEILNPACLDCHELGLEFSGRKTPVTPHPELVNCAQCHIRADQDIDPFRENRFVGIQETKSLDKPQPAGPSPIPHRVFMREDCLLCHDDPNRVGVTQTTHPERLNCRQCHIELEAQVTLFDKNTNVDDVVR